MPKHPTAREKLLAAALELMLARGYPATTVDEICQAAGVSKGSFYHFFDTKEQLALAALDAYLARVGQRVAEGPHSAIQEPRERALAFVDHIVDVAGEVWGDGCLMGSFALDVVETSPAIQQAVSETFTRVARGYAEAFAPALAAGGDGSADERAADLAEQFVVAVEGGIVLAKAHRDWRYATRALARFRDELRRQAGAEA
jgi:TetR/AcrR family transcriptional repressor of nem operon